MNPRAGAYANVRDYDFAYTLFEMADRRFSDGHDLVAAKVSEVAIGFALCESCQISLPSLVLLDVECDFRRAADGCLERISVCDGDFGYGPHHDVFVPMRLAGRIEHHILVYRPRLLADHSCGRLFPSTAGASTIHFSSRRRMGLFELCALADSLSRHSPWQLDASAARPQRRMLLSALCQAL
jgi:hypothetical protein